MISRFVLRIYSLSSVSIILFAFALVFWPENAFPQTVSTRQEIARILVLENVKVQNGIVSGVIRNRSPHTVRNVELFIRYTWLWDDERHPGKVDPGTSTIYTLRQEIPPGGTARFTFTPSPPVPRIRGGQFDTSVSVAGFTEIIPQKR